MGLVASATGIPIAGLAAAPTVFGTNLYLRPTTGVHLPTFAEQALAWNQQSAAPAQRIVINAQQWSAAPSLPTTDAEQLSRLAQRFQTAIDLKSRGGVREFTSREELTRQEATGFMAAEGKERRSSRKLRNEMWTFLLGKDPRPTRVPKERFQGRSHEPLIERFSACDRRELGRHLIALLGKNDEGVRAAAAMELLRLGGPRVPVNVGLKEWKAFNVELIHALLAMDGLPWVVKRQLRSSFKTCAHIPGEWNHLRHRTWMRDVFIRVLNDPDMDKRMRARTFFDAHQWIQEARPVRIRSLEEHPSWNGILEAFREGYRVVRLTDALVNDVYRALSGERAWARHAVPEVLMIARNATPDVIARLVGDLRSEDPHVVRVAAAALGRINDVFHPMSGGRLEDAIAVRKAVTEVLLDASVKEEHRFSILHEFLLRASEDAVEYLVFYRAEQDLLPKALNHTLERL